MSPIHPTVPPTPSGSPAPEPVYNPILAVVQGYGYNANVGIARRQHRALALVLQGHYTARDLTLNAEGLPVVTRFHVRSGSGDAHYYVTRVPNEPGAYDCTCPDTWVPDSCKHRYGAALIQAGLALTHTHRPDIPAYGRTVRTLQHAHPFGSHELAALQVLLNTTEAYDSLAQEAARQHYGANRTYASSCFSAMVDKARWQYGAGYVGWTDNTTGELHSVMAGRPVIPVRWHALELRWYVAGDDGEEDRDATAALLAATLPSWGPLTVEADPVPEAPFEPQDEPDMHYALQPAF